jgi:3-methyladenine DNA glycosylase AlkD
VPRRSARLLADELEARLREHADPRRAVAERAYLKSELEFIGAGTPAVRARVRTFASEHEMDHAALVALVRTLWQRPLHEARAAAIELLGRHEQLLVAQDLALIESLIRRSFTWAYVDPLAIDIAGALVEREPALLLELDRWAGDDDFWVRRAALLALLRPLRRGEDDFERFARYADAMLEEREFFIRKAIGWVLREVSKRRPDLVYEWLAPRAARASGVTIREAVKYLPQRQRDTVMASYLAGQKAPQRDRNNKRPRACGA